MENITLEKKTVFVSYCHKDITEEWIDKFATALGNFGIECIVDIYDLQLGQDLPYFMEQIKRVDKVIMLLGETYKIKANDRQGGVGTETQIISNDVYCNVEQTKFIPVVIAKDKEGNAYLPYYLETRLYTDFSNDSLFSKNIDGLIRQIHKLPKRAKPIVSEPPKRLLEKNFGLSTVKITNDLDFADLSKIIISEMEKYKCTLEEYEQEKDESIIKKIDDSKELRDIYVETIYKLFDSPNIDMDEIICFFESCYVIPREYNGHFYPAQNDGCHFFLQEIIIYTIAILYKKRRYKEIKQLVRATYFPKTDREGIKLEAFYFYLESLEHRNNRLRLNRSSLTADILMQRANVEGVEIAFEDLHLADILILILTEWFYKEKGVYCYWYPTTIAYFRYNDCLQLKKYLVSRERFQTIKELFNVESESSFRKRYEVLQSIIINENRTNAWLERIPSICTIIKPEELFSKD